MKHFFAAIFALLCIGCMAKVKENNKAERVIPGIEVLEKQNFAILKGKKVGLVTNPSGVDRNLRSTIDILNGAPEVELVALFGPEHGVRGDTYAGGKVEDGKDRKTGLPVYSLYGAHRKPSPEMLEGIDVMVYDIQDVGTRSYTFISTLGLVMEACAEKGISVVVLDRPNPLGGNKIEGCVPEDGYYSFVGQYRIPYIYGLTVGELANLINSEGLNRGQKGDKAPSKCSLTVVPMQGWKRSMLYTDTGLPWILPSPNIPYPETALNYPASGICGEIGNFLNIGIGYTLPFGVFGAPWIDAELLKERLDSYDIPGVAFRTVTYKPFAGSCAGRLVNGVQFHFTDYEKAEVTLLQFYVMQAIMELYPDHNPFVEGNPTGLFDKVCGTSEVRKLFSKRCKTEDIRPLWTKDVEAFKALSAKYHLYRQ
ncbi:MAG: exo-beta-N-acetylmuramidase NamZ domain-containing protein [Candidatus Cryptobacteroides sp.]